MNQDPVYDEVVKDFLIRLEEDAAQGDVLPLAEYLSRFPGHDEAIARGYLAHRGRRHRKVGSSDDLSEAPADQIVSLLNDSHGDVERYEIDGEIARGGMGAVFKARDRELDCQVAMKVLLRSGSFSEHRFRREARLTARLSHPGVVPVHDVGKASDDRLFFTMRLVEGRTFRDVIDAVHAKDPEWPLSRAIDVMIRVCETMAFAHSKGIVHRDLKPSNIMVGAFGEVYVMDWGVAGAAHSLDGSEDAEQFAAESTNAPDMLTLDGDVLGTPAYMAPEQALGKREEIGPSVDIYSAGALLYHLLTGHMPYAVPGESTSSKVILERVRRGELEPIKRKGSHLPPELIAIQEKSMARERADRYSDMRSMASDLRAFIDLRLVAAYSEPLLRRFGRWIRRNRELSVGIAIAVTAALIALFVYVDQRSERARVAKLLATQNTPTSVSRTFRDLWPVDAGALPVLRRLVAEASDLLRQRETIVSERQRVMTHALPIDLEAPAEHATARKNERAIVSKQMLITEFERLIAASDAGKEELPPNFTREFYLAEIQLHQKEINDLRNGPIAQLTFKFDDPLEQVIYDGLTRLERDFETLADSTERPGLLSVMQHAIERVETAKRMCPTDLDSRWTELANQMREESLAAKYHGLVLRPQAGLVPIGRDPDSGLLEFAHLMSGEIPTRGTDGRLRINEESAIVLVLIPSGELIRGAQSLTTKIPNFDPLEAPGELPYAAIRMKPFFIGKYEVTQAQWRRLSTRNPSIYSPEKHPELGITALNPVEYVSFDDAAPVLATFDLTFPSEAQWEYALRAATDTPWFTGAERESLVGYANFADKSAATARTCKQGRASWWKEFDDGFPAHSPVNALLPNPFGLYGMLGNVAEWCKDAGPVDPDRSQEDIDDQSRIGTLSGSRPVRGGSFAMSYHETRSAARRHSGTIRRDSDLGLRVARSIVK